MGASKSSFTYGNSNERGLHFERTSEDVAQIVSLCCNNAYNISVHFKNMGVYRNGDLVRAVYPIEDKMLSDFTGGQATIGDNAEAPSYALCDKMEDIRNLTKDYNDEQKLKPRGKRKAKK